MKKWLSYPLNHRKLAVLVLTLSFASLSYAQASNRFNWSPLFGDSYIDNSKLAGDRIQGFKVVTMTTYDSIDSAQMFGLSEINEIRIDCSGATIQYLKSTWFEKPMSKGKVTHMEGSQKTPAGIKNLMAETFERKLFSHICS